MKTIADIGFDLIEVDVVGNPRREKDFLFKCKYCGKIYKVVGDHLDKHFESHKSKFIRKEVNMPNRKTIQLSVLEKFMPKAELRSLLDQYYQNRNTRLDRATALKIKLRQDDINLIKAYFFEENKRINDLALEFRITPGTIMGRVNRLAARAFFQSLERHPELFDELEVG